MSNELEVQRNEVHRYIRQGRGAAFQDEDEAQACFPEEVQRERTAFFSCSEAPGLLREEGKNEDTGNDKKCNDLAAIPRKNESTKGYCHKA